MNERFDKIYDLTIVLALLQLMVAVCIAIG